MEKMPLQDILDNIHDTLADLSSKTYDSVWDGVSADTGWHTGSAATYSISTAAELAGLAQLVNSGTDNFSGKTIVLSANIDLNSMPWIPIGKGDWDNSTNTYNAFYGNFEGNGHFIGNLKIEGDIQYAGLFGYTCNNSGESTYIRNVNLRNVSININSSSFAYAGGIVGCQGGGNQIVENCSAEGNVTANSGSSAYAGGIVGYQSGGGNQSVENCSAEGNVTANSGSSAYAGGIVGYQSGGGSQIVENCSAEGNVTANSGSSAYAGGIVGLQSGSGNQAIENCSAEGDVSANGGSNYSAYAGGIVGLQSGSGNVGIRITNCYFIGDLINPSSSENSYAGGILGYWDGSNTGSGYRCNFTDCYVAATFSGFSLKGSLLGYNSNDSQYFTYTDCYYDKTLAGFNDGTGFGMSTMKMKDKNTYEDWDFGYVWKIEPDKYPALRIFG
jgi:hypothetical protein